MAQGQTGWTRLQAVQCHDEALPEHDQGAVGSQGEATGAASGGEQDPDAANRHGGGLKDNNACRWQQHSRWQQHN